MAILIKDSGEEIEIFPANGGMFSLQELQAAVEGFIEIAGYLPGDYVMMINEEARLLEQFEDRLNRKASDLVGGVILGNAIVGTRYEMGFND